MSRHDDGQASVLIVGLAVVLLMATAVVVNASAAFLQRQHLDTVADGAALAGADAGSRDLEVLYGEGVPADRLDQTATLAGEAVAEHLSRTGAHVRYPGLSYSVSLDRTDDSVVVHLRAPLELPLSLPGAPRSTVVAATATAVVQVDEG